MCVTSQVPISQVSGLGQFRALGLSGRDTGLVERQEREEAPTGTTILTSKKDCPRLWFRYRHVGLGAASVGS